MITAYYKKHLLHFKKPSGTSRGVMTEKESWFILLQKNGKFGIGECGLLRGLSCDDREDYEDKLRWTCENIHLGQNQLWDELLEFPSIQFGMEMAFQSLESNNPFVLFQSEFTNGNDSITINGLVWMGSEDSMKIQIDEKLAEGFKCIKLKIGAINFDHELALLAYIRKHYDANTIEIRVDANGAFDSSDALYKLNQLSGYDLHSVEQPIAVNQADTMAELCKSSPIPIALDEELIGVFDVERKRKLLQNCKPQFIILKPSLVGGFRGTKQWITIAEELNIAWWITSALESNIGLNAIAQWTFLQNNQMPQGLGTGGLYINNFDCPLEISKGQLWYRNEKSWEVKFQDFQ